MADDLRRLRERLDGPAPPTTVPAFAPSGSGSRRRLLMALAILVAAMAVVVYYRRLHAGVEDDPLFQPF